MSTVLRFRIELLEISPPIWRRIEVPGNYSFWDLHVAIQDAMGWTDTHLHVFEIEGGKRDPACIGIPDPDGLQDHAAGWRRKLSRYFEKPGDQVIYEYDFGDSWRHSVMLEAILLPEPGSDYPRCIDGARNCPPEDCGGPWGYEDFLAAILDPDHEEHDEHLAWCGGSFDPEEFDPQGVRFDDPRERLKDLG